MSPMREAPGSHRRETGVVSEPRRRARMHDEGAAQLAKAGVGFDFPARFCGIVPHGSKCAVIISGVVASNLADRPVERTQPRRVAQVEGGATGRRRPREDVEWAADAGGPRPNAIDQAVRPSRPDSALRDGERDDTSSRVAETASPKSGHERSPRHADEPRRSESLPDHVEAGRGGAINDQNLGVEPFTGGLKGRKTFGQMGTCIQTADDHGELAGITGRGHRVARQGVLKSARRDRAPCWLQESEARKMATPPGWVSLVTPTD